MNKHYDLIIIGGGGGTKLRPASALGKKVALIEKEAMGGTCLNKGCIPSKMLIYPADLLTHSFEDLGKFGIDFDKRFKVNFSELIEYVTQRVKKDSDSIEEAYGKDSSLDFYKGEATFLDNHRVEVNGQVLSADKIYISVGSRPSIPNIKGLENTPYFDSTKALRNKKQPKKMIIIGGGYIATELGHFYGAMGTEVHFLVRSEMIKAEDKDIRKIFQEDFARRYNVHFGYSPQEVNYQDDTFSVKVEDRDGKTSLMQADSLLVATGVVPNSDTLKLENTDIQMDSKGYIQVDDFLQTSVEGVYALGDVIGKYLFRHSVNFEGEYLFGQHYGGVPKQEINYPPMPHAIFSYPQVAGVGMREDDLEKMGKKKDEDFVVAINEYQHSAMGMAMRSEVGMVKLIADKNTQKLLGAHIIGEKASDIIHVLIHHMTLERKVEDLLKMIYIHPALSEVVRNAVRKLLTQLLK